MHAYTQLKFTPEEIDKLHFVCKSICTRPDNSVGRPTKKELLSGLIDSAYADALTNLYSEDLLDEEDLEEGIQLLPDFLQDRTRRRAYG